MGFWDSVVSVFTAPVQVAYDFASIPAAVIVDAVKGDNILSGVESRLKNALGNTLNISTGGLNELTKTDLGTTILTKNFEIGGVQVGIDKLTLGYSTDWVNTLKAQDKLANGVELDSSDYYSAGRFLVKSAAIGGTSALGAKALAAGKEYAALGTAGISALRGNPTALLESTGALPAGAGDIFNTVNQALPSASTVAAAQDIASQTRSALSTFQPTTSSPAQAGASVNDPYGTPQGAVNYTVHTGENGIANTGGVVVAVAVVAGLYMLTRKRRN